MGEAFWRHHDGVQPLPKVSVNTQASHSLRSNDPAQPHPRQTSGKRTQRDLATRDVTCWHSCPRPTLGMAHCGTSWWLTASMWLRLHGGGQRFEPDAVHH